MKTIRKRLTNVSGTSIMELLVALFLAGVVTATIFEIYINQHKNWVIQEDVTDVQQNARAAIDELTRNIRMAGHGLPFGIEAVKAYNTNPDTIIICYYDGNCAAPIVEDMPLPSAELRCDGHDVSCFYDGQWIYISDPASGSGEFFKITQVQVASAHIQHNTMSLSKAYPEGSELMAVNRVKYFIDRSDTLHPNLMIEVLGQKPQVYAENIEDMQFRYKMKNGIVTDAPSISSNIREVEISIVARSAKPDIDFPDNPYRRRTYASKVNLRNLDI